MQIIFSIIAVIVLLIMMPIIGVAIGAFSGWAVGLMFEDTIRHVLFTFGIDTSGVSMWQLGATLGFVGSFFRTTITKQKD